MPTTMPFVLVFFVTPSKWLTQRPATTFRVMVAATGERARRDAGRPSGEAGPSFSMKNVAKEGEGQEEDHRGEAL